MDKPWTTLRVAHRLPTGRRLPTSSTALDSIRIKSGKVKTISPVQALAYSTPVAVQATVTTAIDAVPRLAKDPTQLAKTEGLPEFVQCPDVAQRTRRFEFDRRQRRVQEIGTVVGFRQTGDHRIKAVGQLVQATQRNQGAMFGLAGVVTKRLDQFDRRMTRLERDVGIAVETLAVFIRFWLSTTPALPEPAAQAARAKTGERYEAFVAALGRRLAKGPKLRQEISEDVSPQGDEG